MILPLEMCGSDAFREAWRSGFDLSVSGRPPTSSEAAGPLEKKQNKHCFLAVTPPLSTWWVDQARRRRKFYGGTTLKITFSITFG